MEIRTERIYTGSGERRASERGKRVLVDRLWPRGISRERANIDLWLKDAAPSDELRKWFAHDPDKWKEFKRRYAKELDANKEALEPLLGMVKKGDVVLLYAAKDEVHNNAVALKAYLEHELSE
jgi:uncharacterized protein YeaO (DUF488 family)